MVRILSHTPSLFNAIPDRKDAGRVYAERNLSDLIDSKIRDLFLKHNVQDTFSILLTHWHFELEEGESLVHYDNVATPWKEGLIDPEHLAKAKPKQWAFTDDGDMFPSEFSHTPEPSYQKLDPETHGVFLEEFNGLLREEGLQKYLGLGLADESELSDAAPVEVTWGWASVCFPFKLCLGDGIGEVGWRFTEDDERKVCCQRSCGGGGPLGGC